MGDMGDDFRELGRLKKERRLIRKEEALGILAEKGISWKTKNGGIHLVIQEGPMVIDLWPTTGRWKVRGRRRKFGIRKLIEFISATREQDEKRKNRALVNCATRAVKRRSVGLTLGDYDIWYSPCESCGYDTGKSADKNNRCWKCGSSIHRDYSDRAMKRKK